MTTVLPSWPHPEHRPGDVVNGYLLLGVEWVPLADKQRIYELSMAWESWVDRMLRQDARAEHYARLAAAPAQPREYVQQCLDLMYGETIQEADSPDPYLNELIVRLARAAHYAYWQDILGGNPADRDAALRDNMAAREAVRARCAWHRLPLTFSG